MRVGVLGPLQVEAGGQIVDIGGARLRALLIRLAMDAGRPVTSHALARALWPDDPPADPAHALQSLVSRLRRTLPVRSALRSSAGGYCLDVPPGSVDALSFELLAAQGRRALREQRPEAAAMRLREALALWRGEALADARDAPYAVAAAARLDEQRLTATEDRIEADLALGTGHLVPELEGLTSAHPLRERLQVLLLQALRADGRRSEALSAYARYRRLLAEELGTDPGSTLEAIHIELLRTDAPARSRQTDERANGRSDGRVNGQRGNLRAPLTSFVGRTDEQTRIRARLGEARLVTLVGPGGVGKTRLATTVAADVEDAPDGVWLVELAAVTEPADVAPAIARTLGLREAHPADAAAPTRTGGALSLLVEALSAARTLLVLDNCEHLLDAVTPLAEDLLGRCPRLRILATSREPLGIGGEALFPVQPLGLPDEPRPVSAEEAMSYPAVRLFADRASAARPDFAVTGANADAVIRICRRLDGLPLSIELAAARVRAVPVQELAIRLDDRFTLLAAGTRTALPRHRTLSAVVSWSWDLLDEEERRFARRLAVFPTGITPESAERVAAPTANGLEALSALVDKSLLQPVDGTEPRYRMLETIREYALQRLAEAGETDRTRAAHTAYYLELAERAEPHLRGPDQIPWIRTLETERDNLLAALNSAVNARDAATAVRLTAALGQHWTIQGNHAEAAERLRTALALPGDVPVHARAVATFYYLLTATLSWGRAALVPGTSTGVPEHDDAYPAADLIDVMLALTREDSTEGLRLIARRPPGLAPDPWTRATLQLLRAFFRGAQDDLSALDSDLRAAAKAFQEAGERWGEATCLSFFAHTRIMIGDFDAAITALETSIRLLHELDSADNAFLPKATLATTRARKGDADRARAELLDVIAAGTGTPSAAALVAARLALGDLARQQGELDEAARHYAAVSDDPVLAGFLDGPYLVMLRCSTGLLETAAGRPAAARRHLTEALGLAGRTADRMLLAMAGVAAAALSAHLGDAAAAAELLGAAHRVRGVADEFNPDVAGTARDVRAKLGEPAYQTAYARGRSHTADEAVELIRTALHAPLPL